MLSSLTKPYPFETSFSKRWKRCLLVGCFVFLFLFIFQPFGLSTLERNILTTTFGYGLTCFAVMAVLNIGVISLFPGYFSESNWTSLKAIVWTSVNILFIGLANVIYSAYIGIADFSFDNLIRFEVFALALGVFPVSLSVILNQNRLQSSFEKTSEEINSGFKNRREPITEAAKIPVTKDIEKVLCIRSENGKDHLDLNPDDLLFIRSSDNYVEVFYLQKKSIVCKLIRNSLKSIADSLIEDEQFFRCHKSYLVNLNKVERVSGNAQGYKLHLSGSEERIPVSRTLNETIREKLAAHP